MKRYLVISSFLGLLWILDLAIGIIVGRSLESLKVGTLGIVNNALKDTSQVLVLGSSRALHHYDTKLMEESLGISCYNAGLGGQGVLYSYALLSERMLRHKPDMVILDISPNVFMDRNAIDKLRVFLPFIDRSHFFAEIIEINSDVSKMTKVLNSLKYNSMLYELVLGHVVTTMPYKGYVPLDGMLALSSYRPSVAMHDSISELNRKYLRRIVETCKQNHVLPVVVVSPSYQDFDSSGAVKRYLAHFAETNGLTMIDYSGNEFFLGNALLFKDQLHMNRRGAYSFTTDLNSKLISLLKSFEAGNEHLVVAKP